MAEWTFITQYRKARRDANTDTMRDMLLALPVLLANEPTSAFLATLSFLDNGGMTADLLRCEPHYNQKPEFALVGTAIDAIGALQMQVRDLALILQSQLGQPVRF